MNPQTNLQVIQKQTSVNNSSQGSSSQVGSSCEIATKNNNNKNKNSSVITETIVPSGKKDKKTYSRFLPSGYLPTKQTVSKFRLYEKKSQQQIKQQKRKQKEMIDDNIYKDYFKINTKNIKIKEINQNYFEKILGLIEDKPEGFPQDITSLSFCKLKPSRLGSITNLLRVNGDKLYKIERTPEFMKNVSNNIIIDFIIGGISNSVSVQNILS